MMRGIFDALKDVSLYAAIIAAAILLFRTLFKTKLSAKLRYLMWLALILRLMVPSIVPVGFHLITLPEAAAVTTAPAADSIETVLEERISANPDAPAGDMTVVPANHAPNFVKPENTGRAIDWREMAVLVWGLGAVACGIWTLVSKGRLNRLVLQNGVPTHEDTLGSFRAIMDQLGIKRHIALFVVDMEISPMLMLRRLRPVVVLPRKLQGEELKYAILHELTHFKRGDMGMLHLMSLLRSVYWFHPLVHIAFEEMLSDMESACDAQVLNVIAPGEKRVYITTLLSLFTSKAGPALSMSRARSKRAAKRRLDGAFMKKKSGIGTGIVAAAMACALFIGCFTTACQPVRESGKAGERIKEEHILSNGSRVAIYGEIVVPQGPLPVGRAIPYEETPEELMEQIASLLLGDATLYQDVGTKDMLTRKLAHERAELEKYRDKLSDRDIFSVESTLSDMEKDISSTPETAPPGVLADLAKYPPRYAVMAELDRNSPGEFVAYRPRYLNIRFVNNGLPKDGSKTISWEEAQRQAEALVREIGIAEEFSLVHIEEYPINYSHAEYRLNLQQPAANQGICFTFMRDVGSAPQLYSEQARMGYHASIIETLTYTGGKITDDVYPEMIDIRFDPYGLTGFEWRNMGDVLVEETKVETIGIDRAKAAMLEALVEETPQYRIENAAQNDNDLVETSRIEYRIDRVELGEIGVRNYDGSTILIPAWEFFGNIMIADETGTLRHTQQSGMSISPDDRIYEKDLRYALSGSDSNSLCTIHGVTGEYIDREFGIREWPAGESPKAPPEGLRATYFTSYAYRESEESEITANRCYNIAKAAEILSGCVIQPGEEWSFNDTVGMRTEENGWRAEIGISTSSEDTSQVGGGVSQVSATLYNALLKANVTVTDRRALSVPASYVPIGLDATVDSGGIDLKFINDTGAPLRFECEIKQTKATRRELQISIYGTPLQDGQEYRLRSEVVKKEPITEVTYIDDPELPKGEEVTRLEARPRIQVVVYRDQYQDGEFVGGEFLYGDAYRGNKKIVHRGTK